jgi:hypothetical protein
MRNLLSKQWLPTYHRGARLASLARDAASLVTLSSMSLASMVVGRVSSSNALRAEDLLASSYSISSLLRDSDSGWRSSKRIRLT